MYFLHSASHINAPGEGKLQSHSVGNLAKPKQILKINIFQPRVDPRDNLFQGGFL